MSIATREAQDVQSACSLHADRIETAGLHLIRYGLVLVLLWIGGMKFTAYEATGIAGFVSHSPLMFWAYGIFSQGQFSALIGLSELLIACLLALRPVSARCAVIGGGLAVAMFLTTLTFLLSTPGVIEPSLGFPALSAMPGQFLIKDVVLLGASLWLMGEAMTAVRCEESQRTC